MKNMMTENLITLLADNFDEVIIKNYGKIQIKDEPYNQSVYIKVYKSFTLSGVKVFAEHVLTYDLTDDIQACKEIIDKLHADLMHMFKEKLSERKLP